MVLLAVQVKDLKQLALAVHQFADALQELAGVHPPADRAALDHPEIRRLTREFERAVKIVEAAVEAEFMTAAQYERIAKHFEAIAEGMEGGALKEFAAERRRATAGRRVAAPTVRKPRRPRR